MRLLSSVIYRGPDAITGLNYTLPAFPIVLLTGECRR